jgi:hypothetical protein
MKKIFAFTFLFASIAVSGQTKDFIQASDLIKSIFIATGPGQPNGEKTAATIGQSGGSLKSSDNRIELIFPAGALSSDKQISIQPITNLAQGSIGKGYKMEPSGIQFEKPVQLIYHYTNAETEGDSPELIGLATQDDKGFWHQLNKLTHDTVAKTITGYIKHFSLYNPQWKIYFKPQDSKVKVSKEVKILLFIAPIEGGNPEPDEISQALAYVFGDETSWSTLKWYVNAVPNGNSSVGFVITQGLLNQKYKAPAQVPVNNPVEIYLEIHSPNTVTKTPFRKSCEVLVYDNAYEVSMKAELKGGSEAAWGGIATYRDEGSFVVSLEKNKPQYVVADNKLETVTYSTCPDRVITNPTTCTGILHVAGTRQIKVTPANPPGQPYPIVEIWFAQYPTELTRFTFNCPPPPSAKGRSKGNVGLETGAPPPMLMFFGMPALPTYIKFIAKGEEQIILEKGSPGSEIFYKFSVRKVKDD